MNSFWDLVGFEYKKIFKRKSTSIILGLVVILIIVVTIANANGGTYWNNDSNTPLLGAMRLDRDTIHSKAGAVDEKIIKEAIEQNAILIANDDNYLINDYGKFVKGNAYCKYTLPYENIVNMINVIYEANQDSLATTDGIGIININTVKPIDTLKADDAEKFYDLYNKQTSNMINARRISSAEKEKHVEMLSAVKKPFYNDYFGGYAVFAMMLNVFGMILLTVISICVAPIFANEYQTRTDQILLSSKYGKNKVILAKIFTGTTFSMIISIATSILFLLALFCIHGISGWSVSLQIMQTFTSYPLTLLQAVLISILVLVLVCIAFSMFTMLLSSLFKSTFGVIILSFIMIFVPTFISVSPKSRFLYQLVQLFPIKAIDFPGIFSDYLFDIFGLVLTPPTFYCIFVVIAMIVMFPFCYRGFKNHQVG